MNKKILHRKPNELLIEFLRDYSEVFHIDVELSKQMIKDNFRYYKKHDICSVSSELEKQWYKSLECNSPDYSVYMDKNYYVDIWCCWAMYSREYIKSLQKMGTLTPHNLDISIADALNENSKSVIDMGCGLGYSTAALREIFPTQDVYGFNLKDSDQYVFNEKVGQEYNFKMTYTYENIGEIDTVFASEYFEHFERPIEHLVHIIENLNPKYFIVANSFNTNSIGHFHEYKHNNRFFDETINETKISRRWNNELRSMGYTKLNTKIFNSKPSLFVRNSELPYFIG